MWKSTQVSLQQKIQEEKTRALDKRSRLVSQIDKARMELNAVDEDLVKWTHAEEMISRLVPSDVSSVNGATEPKRRGRGSAAQKGSTNPKRLPVLKEGSFGAATLRVVESFGERGATHEMIYEALHASGIDALPIHVGKSLQGHLNNGRLVFSAGRWFHPDFVDGQETSESETRYPSAEQQEGDEYPAAASAGE